MHNKEEHEKAMLSAIQRGGYTDGQYIALALASIADEICTFRNWFAEEEKQTRPLVKTS